MPDQAVMDAARKQRLTELIYDLKDQLSYDGTVGLQARNIVVGFNALSLPWGYIYVGPDCSTHYVMIRASLETSRPGPMQVEQPIYYAADVIWDFDAVNGLWTVIKDRCGHYKSLSPLKCGGMLPKVLP